ncbi:MAG: ATP-dependent DNA helicase DinG [Treponema sp.]|jgi:ATP-dependent DNA helicase DinG|nr:ATP-dependent DNA helicase DinG [Treponema sp.]
MRAARRFTEACIQKLKSEISGAGGNEVFALGWLDKDGRVGRIEVRARGNEGAVLALRQGSAGSAEGEEAPDVLIHNHPSGFLVPSDNDLVIAGRAAEDGTGAFIVDNRVEEIYVVAEPVRRRVTVKLRAEELTAMLREGGAVAKRLSSYETRQSQLDLMELIVRGFNEDALVAAEAGTGVGKSFAYLLPAVHYALANNERIVISTATITLQQQLYEKDIPLLSSALPPETRKKLKVALMKGRGNYLCRRRLEETLKEASLFDEAENEELARICAWAEQSKTGSRSDLSFVPSEGIWSRVRSEGDLCMGMRCPERERCFVFSLRREAADARVLVVNHHLLFADLAARHEGAGYDGTVVLPPYTRVIIDEAHTVEGAATSFFSKEWSGPGLYRQLGRLYRVRQTRKQGLLVRLAPILRAEDRLDAAAAAIEKIRKAAADLDAAADELCGEEGIMRLSARRAGAEEYLFPRFIDLRKKILALIEIIQVMLDNRKEGDEDEGGVWELRAVLRRLDTAAGICGAFVEYRERPSEVMWMERHRSGEAPPRPVRTAGRNAGRNADSRNPGSWIVFTVTPVEVAPALGEALFKPNRTVICVSATLTLSDSEHNHSFRYWAGRSGFALASGRETLQGVFPSPFPYAAAVLLAVPRDSPLPEEENYGSFVDRAAAALAAAAGGSALILFTSYQSLRSAYDAALPELQSRGIRCLRQGEDDRTRLLQRFLADEHSVLFATDSFWEGVDAPGDTLRLVILCRLPFRTPNDPVFEARREAVERGGGSAFMDLSLPESVMKFKQGFGRLMRRSSDHGVVAVLDGRILRKRYGGFFLSSLPETKKCFGDFETLVSETKRFLQG